MKQILKNSFALLSSKEKQQFYSLAFFDVIISLLDILSLAVLLFIVNIYAQPLSALRFHWLPHWATDRNSLWPIGIFLLAFSIKNCFGYLLQKAQFNFVYKVAARLSGDHLLKYLQGNYQEFSQIDSSVHIRSVGHHPIEFAHYILAGIQQILTQSVLIIGALIGILLFDAKLFAILFVLLLPPVLLIAFFIKRKTKTARQQTKLTGEKTLQYLKEALVAYVESNVYNRHHFFAKRYLGWQKKLNYQLAGLQQIQGMSGRLLEVFAVLGLFILIVLNQWSGNGSGFNITAIGAFVAAAYKIIPGIVKILNCSGQVRAYGFTVDDLLKKQQANNIEQSTTAEKISKIEFQQISFNYGDQSVLKELSWTTAAGDFVGISGASGIGKTTIINLLLGFEQQQSGIITINDSSADIKSLIGYRSRVAYVKQQPFLIHDSIVKNILLDEDTVDKNKLNDVLNATGLNELIKNFPEGINKIITENGKNISGGQRQRIVIARALYKDADVILLDEPFNELDRLAEQKMLEYFKSLSQKGKIILLITHNKESLAHCNKIISL